MNKEVANDTLKASIVKNKLESTNKEVKEKD